MVRYGTVGAPGGAWNRRRWRIQQFNAGLLASNDDRNESMRDASGRGRDYVEAVKVTASYVPYRGNWHGYCGLIRMCRDNVPVFLIVYVKLCRIKRSIPNH